MLNLILFDTDARHHLLPLTATRPVGELRVGMLTLREKWERRLGGRCSYITQEYLQERYPIAIEEENLILNAAVLPTTELCKLIEQVGPGEALLDNGELIAARLNEQQIEALIEDEQLSELHGIPLPEGFELLAINRLWDIVRLNDRAMRDDFELLVRGRKSQPLSDSNRLIGAEDQLFIEEGVELEACTINTKTGPVYIAKNTIVMEGGLLRGPIYLGAECIVKMGAKIYGPTAAGPGCRLGGELKNVVMIANSNKSHDGYLGDAVLGEWCNLGADTNNSNLKNNYSEVRLWDYTSERFERSGMQFMGLVMGDHAKCGINTMLNTGTVIGVFANVFGSGYQKNFIPDFAWGGPDSPQRTYKFSDACETAALVMARRNVEFTEYDKAILYHVYDQTAKFRRWED
jgi:UDP-N-acetylglucosamine diphosphorylase/glucosamine-1-phosphate N-acetyltransferase